MNIQFATCNRKEALEFIKRVYPDKEITDMEDSAKELLDFVEKDIVRIQDPMMYGNKIHVIPGNNWIENKKMREDIVNACKIFH